MGIHTGGLRSLLIVAAVLLTHRDVVAGEFKKVGVAGSDKAAAQVAANGKPLAKGTEIRIRVVKVGASELHLYAWDPEARQPIDAYQPEGSVCDPIRAWNCPAGSQNWAPGRSVDRIVEDQVLKITLPKSWALSLRGQNGFFTSVTREDFAVDSVVAHDDFDRVTIGSGWVVDVKVVKEQF